MRKIFPYLALVGVVGIAYLSFEWAVGAVIHNRPVVSVPDLTGRSLADALTLLGPVHLALMKDGEQYDKMYPAGSIIRQNPPAGMSVREGRVIRITLSQGGEMLMVPDLTSQPMRNAQTTLQNAGLSIGEVDRRPSLRFDKDQVMSTDPPVGTPVAKNALVNVVVSDGAPGGDVVLIPDFIGKALPEANAWASAHQMPVSIREENDPLHTQNEVLMQAPTADSPVKPGDELTIVINNLSAQPGQGPHVHFQVPAGENDVDIRILLVDESGEHEVFRKTQAPGSQVDVPVQPHGRARVRIFVNGVNVEEQTLP